MKIETKLQKIKDKGFKFKLTEEFTPEYLQDEIQKYFDWCNNNPLYKYDVVKTGVNCGEELKIKLPRPYLVQGLVVHLNINIATWYQWIAPDCQHTEIHKIALHATDIIRDNQLSGASAGIFNPLVISRLQGLTDTNLAFSVNINPDKKSIEEVQAIIETLEKVRNKNTDSK